MNDTHTNGTDFKRERERGWGERVWEIPSASYGKWRFLATLSL